MRSYYIGTSVLFAVVALGSLLSRTLGWYHSYWYTDVILHFISGMAFGFLFIAFHKKYEIPSLFIFLISIISFAVFGSELWEFWEFFGWHITPSHTQFYIPELGDTLSDIFFGLIGGIGSGIVFVIKNSNPVR